MSERCAPVTFVLGGARSGNSRYAEELIERYSGPWHYVATAEAWDDEMRGRIAEHRARRGANWQTIEAPLELSAALEAIPVERTVLVDCLTLWLTNLMLADRDLARAYRGLDAALHKRRGAVILVANEVGLGIVPDNALARAFRDEAGRLNQQIASVAGQVFFMVAGLPLKVK